MKNTNLVSGKINSGKTTSFLFNEVEKSIKLGENLLIIDEKEEYINSFWQKMIENNYKIYVLNLKDGNYSNTYNPLLIPYNMYKSGNKDKAVKMIEEIGLEIFKDDVAFCDPFWNNCATSYFLSLVLILFKEGNVDEINLGSIQTMLNKGEVAFDDTTVIKKYFEKLDVMDPIYVSGSITVYSPYDTRGSIISVMKQKLNKFCLREMILNNLCGNEIDLCNLGKKTAIFIIGDEDINSLGNILVNELLYIDEKFTFILDNIDNIPILSCLKKLLERKEKTFVATRCKDSFFNRYGKDYVYRFENIIEDFDNVSYVEKTGNVNYPVSSLLNKKYFNIEEFVKNNK